MGVSVEDLTDELSLQILEVFSRAVGACDFAQYQHPSVADLGQDMASMKQRIASIPKSKNEKEEARLVFVISAFKDFEQLQELIQSIHLEQHLILIHLETYSDPKFEIQVRGLIKIYANSLVLQFGSVIYPSDSLSQINFAIMQWIHQLDFQFDHLITVSGAAYPLYSSPELARHLKTGASHPRVRLGLLQGGDPRLCRRRAASFGLFYTRGRNKRRVVDIYDVMDLLPNMTVPIQAFGPKGFKQTCRRKTTSGNTAAFDFEAVQLLSTSTMVKDYFARFKQAGQCCVEESSWGAAVHIIGRKDDVPLPGVMWQAWPCGMGMGNVFLLANTSCLRMDDKSVFPDGPVEMKTVQAVEKALMEGKQQGHLFARKFQSSDRHWMEWIQANLHNHKS